MSGRLQRGVGGRAWVERHGLIAMSCVLVAACSYVVTAPSNPNEQIRSNFHPASNEEISEYVGNAYVEHERPAGEGTVRQGALYCRDGSVHRSQSRVPLTGEWRVADRMLCTRLGPADAREICQPLFLDRRDQMFILDEGGAMVAVRRSFPEQNYCLEPER